MIEALITLILLGALALIWQDALRARELAARIGHQLCTNSGLQLLDQSVSLRRLRLIRTASGRMGLRRQYAFDVSTNGHDRHRGTLRLREGKLEDFSLPLPADTQANRTTIVH
ncbi:MAG: DUF3301 domain-containing protein [Tahibacter sp.]